MTSPRIVEPGAVFARLTVLKFARKGAVKSLDRYLCQCSCGGKTEARRTDLVNGRKRSCGCLAREAKERAANRAFTK